MPLLPLQPGHGRSLEVRTSGAHSRRSRNRQPRAFDAHPCAALYTRRCRTDHTVRISNEFHLASRPAPFRAHGTATTSAYVTTIGNGSATNAGGSAHNTVPLRSKRQPGTFI